MSLLEYANEIWSANERLIRDTATLTQNVLQVSSNTST